MADDLDLIRSRINIVDLVSQRVSLKKAGKNWKGLCPFHDDRNPSFDVDPSSGRYRCWSCKAGGDIFNWVMETQKVSFVEAMKILADQAGVTLSKSTATPEQVSERQTMFEMMDAAQKFFVEQLQLTASAREYCESRNFDKDTLEKWGIGYGPEIEGALGTVLKKKGYSLQMAESLFLVDQDTSGAYRDRYRSRLMIPIRDERGAIIGFGGRIIGSGIPKYINSSDSPLFHKSKVLFGLNVAKESISKTDLCVLVEGYMDVIACHRAGVTQAVASLGTSLTEDQVKLIKRWAKNVVILYDRDEAGQKAAEKATEMLMGAGISVRVALPPEGEDPDSLLNKQGPQAVLNIVEKPIDPIQHQLELLKLKSDPNTQEFWEKAVQILCLARTPLELEAYVAPLASIYPGVTDRQAGQAALRGMVRQARKARARGEYHEQPQVSRQHSHKLPPGQAGLEGTILKALMQPELTEPAWELIKKAELFRPGAASLAAAAVRLAFKSEPPKGELRVWLNKLESPDAIEILSQLNANEGLPVKRSDLDAAAAKLEERHEQRKREEMQTTAANDDAALREYAERLKKAKGG